MTHSADLERIWDEEKKREPSLQVLERALLALRRTYEKPKGN